MDESSKQIVVEEVVAKLRHFGKLYGIDSMFIVGGYCREAYFGTPWKANDIDVASAYHEQALQLGGFFATEVANTTPKFYHRSGAAAMEYQSEFGSIKVEFQGRSTNSYMYNEDVKEWLRQNGIEDVPIMNNIYGRDFTMNSMLFSLNTGQFYDPTGQAAPDLEKGLVKSLLPAEMLVKYNPLAMLRAIRFALTYDFHIHSDLRIAMKGRIDLLKDSLTEDRIMKEVVRILKIDGPKSLELLKNMELHGLLMHPDIKDHVTLESADA